MKKSIFLFISSFTVITISAQTSGINWSSPIDVGVGATHNNIYPRLTLTNNDIPLVVWEDNSPAKVYSSRKNGATFDTPIAINNSGISPWVANWSGAEVSSSGDTAFIVFTSMPVLSGKAYAVRSIDGGISYSDTVRIDQVVGQLPSFPSVVVMPGGNPIVNYMSSDAGTMLNTEYTVSKSIDGGLTFLPSVTPVNPGNVCECCPGTMAISGNTQVLLYRNNITDLRDMWASFSTDASISFPISTEIDTTNWFITSCPSSGPSGVIAGDSLVYTWMSDATGDSRIYIGTMNINDQQMGQHRQIYPVGSSTQNNPVIAGKGDTLGLVWLGYNGTSQEVLFTCSFTGAAGLGNVIDTLTKGLSGHQSRPDIAFNNGKFHIVYSNSVGTQVKYVEGTYVTNLSVDEITNNGTTIEVYPNPSRDKISFKVKGDYRNSDEQINFYNSIGQKVGSNILGMDSSCSMDVSDWNAGIYFCTIISDSSIIGQTKFIVSK